jgi:large subunit ribosomal protein L17
MRHRKKFNHLSRQAPHRKAMLANMASSLIMHKRITTTTAKAKALRMFVEPVITRSKEDSTHSRRMVFKQLRDKNAVTELFRDVSAKVGDRPGGYTRIIKIGNRLGDNADMCIIELVDYNEIMIAEKASAKPKTSRRRRGGSKKTTDLPEGAAIAEVADEVGDVAEVVEETETATETEAEVTEVVEEVEEVAKPEMETPEVEEVKAEDKEPEAKAEDESPEEEEKKEE